MFNPSPDPLLFSEILVIQALERGCETFNEIYDFFTNQYFGEISVSRLRHIISGLINRKLIVKIRKHDEDIGRLIDYYQSLFR